MFRSATLSSDSCLSVDRTYLLGFSYRNTRDDPHTDGTCHRRFRTCRLYQVYRRGAVRMRIEKRAHSSRRPVRGLSGQNPASGRQLPFRAAGIRCLMLKRNLTTGSGPDSRAAPAPRLHPRPIPAAGQACLSLCPGGGGRTATPLFCRGSKPALAPHTKSYTQSQKGRCVIAHLLP